MSQSNTISLPFGSKTSANTQQSLKPSAPFSINKDVQSNVEIQIGKDKREIVHYRLDQIQQRLPKVSTNQAPKLLILPNQFDQLDVAQVVDIQEGAVGQSTDVKLNLNAKEVQPVGIPRNLAIGCNRCEKRFNDNYQLANHKRKDHGAPLLSCKRCKATYMANSSLYRHSIEAHRIHTSFKGSFVRKPRSQYYNN